MQNGIFITLEGSEGCGKSTQFARLAARLAAVTGPSRPLVTVREPGGTPLGEEIRRLLKHTAPGWSVAPGAELLLFAASRAQLVRDTIAPALAAGGIVLCDRFLDSTTVYQGVARRLDPAAVGFVNSFAAGTRLPDVTLLLDLPPEIAHERVKLRPPDGHPPDRMESEPPPFYAQVRAGYLALAARHPERFAVLDAARSPDEVETQIWTHLTARLPSLI